MIFDQNLTEEYWADAEEVNALDFSNLLNEKSFIPPPPRPSLFHLQDLGSEAFSASCDLCDWALNNRSVLLSSSFDNSLTWLLTLIVVAMFSALIGAAVMLIVLHCKRLKVNANLTATCGDDSDPTGENENNKSNSSALTTRKRKKPFLSILRRQRNDAGQSGNVVSPPRRLCSVAPANENHYTVTEHTPSVTPVEEALYAELQEQVAAYQNISYLQVSEPSSAYYSDLSTLEDRTYESVEQYDKIYSPDAFSIRIATIAKTVPSDYV